MRRRPPRLRADHLYAIFAGDLVKIGYTSNPRARLQNYRLHNPEIRKFDALVQVQPGRGLLLEEALHKKYSAYRSQGEWFRLNEGQRVQLLKDLGKLGGLNE